MTSVDVAVIGMACRLPGAANLEEFWSLLVEGRNAVEEFPVDRLDRDLYYDPERGKRGKIYSTRGGVVPDLEDDPDLSEFPAELVSQYSSAFRHLLAVIANSFRQGGLDPHAAASRNTGLFAAHASSGSTSEKLIFSTSVEDTVQRLTCEPAFQDLPPCMRESLPQALIDHFHRTYPRRREGGAPIDIAAHGISLAPTLFGWQGPLLSVDAACSSSLYAISMAADALEQGQCDLAVVAGAAQVTAGGLVLFSQAQALGDGGSFPFDARANGFLSSEGYCAVILEPLDRARRANRKIAGVIRAVGLSSDGRGRSVWAPRLEGQTLAIRRAWAGGLDPSTLQYVEAHATSTQVGDLVELRSLAAAFQGGLDTASRIPIGSVKANLGHCKEAAGLASLIKVLLSIQHGVIPPAAGFERPQPGLDWDALPFYPPLKPTPWSGPRRAAIDSFGIGGVNAHVIVEGPFEPSRTATPPSACDDEIVVTGRGCVLPGAFNVPAFERLLQSGQRQVANIPPERWDSALYFDDSPFQPWRTPVTTGAFVQNYRYDWRRHRIPPLQVQFADPLQFMALDAADQALQEAGFSCGELDLQRTAVVAGTTFGGEFCQQLARCVQLPEFERQLALRCEEGGVSRTLSDELIHAFRETFHRDLPALRDETGSFSSSTLASRIARTFDLMGGATALDQGFSGSIAALRCAMNLLQTGRCDAVVCVGADRQMGVSTLENLAALGVRRPLGEGAVAVVLRRKSDVKTSRHFGVLQGDFHSTVEHPSEARDFESDHLSQQFGDLVSAAGMASLLEASVKGGGAIRRSAFGGFVGTLVCEDAAPVQSPSYRKAMLFAGQGSQYQGMLRGLIQHRAAARRALGELNQTLLEAGLPTFEELAWADAGSLGPALLGEDILRTQLSVLGADYILYRTVHDAGVHADVVAGHSYGEYAALVAAEAITLRQAVRITRDRSAILEAHPETAGALMAVGCASDAVLQLREESGAAIHLAILNTAAQTVIGGTRAQLERFASTAGRRHILTHLLRVPRPYHTPLLRPAQKEFRALLESEAFLPPKIPFLSSVAARYLAEPSEIREHLAAQMATTIRYRDVIERLVTESGSLALIEIGPRQVLTGLHRAWQSDRIQLLPTDEAKGSTNSLARVLALAPRSASPEASVRGTHDPGPEVVHFDATARRRAANLSRGSAAAVTPTDSDDEAEFLIQFVCEQTGYSRDIVDLDADLEKDLGIDSIRKARLLGELRDRKRISFSAMQNLTLEDFPTLRSILNQCNDGREAEPLESPGELLLGSSSREHRRYILRVAAPDRPSPQPQWTWQSSAAVAGGSPLVAALRRSLERRGVSLVPISEVPMHLLLTHGRNPDANIADAAAEAYQLCRDWIVQINERGQLAQASLTAVTSLGGDFGFGAEIETPLGGALAGFLKALKHEFPAVRIKIIDAPPNEPDLAENVCQEIESGATEIEVAFARGARRVIRAFPQDPAKGVAPLPERGSTWVVTGGARGITALAARDLGRRYGLRLHLIGLTRLDAGQDPTKQAEIRQNLAEFSATGIEATYHACDISDRSALAELLQEIRARGPICGILHGAGYEAAASISKKLADSLERTIRAKSIGAQHLMDLTENDPLTHFLAFGSISGRFGVPGQTDYGLATELLSKMVQSFRRRRGIAGAVSFLWPAWAGTGMAMRPETKLAIDFAGHQMIPPSEGLAYLISELEAGCPEGEVLIAAPSNLDHDRILTHSTPARSAVLDRLRKADELLQAEVDLHEDRHAFWKDHRWLGAALLPASAAAAMFVEAASEWDPCTPVRVLRDLVLVNPVRVDAAAVSFRSVPLRVQVAREGKDNSCRITTEFCNRSGLLMDPHRVIATARTAMCSSRGLLLEPPPQDTNGLEWHTIDYREAAACDAERLVYHGPSMRCLRAVADAGICGMGSIIAPPEDGWRLSPALLDACFVACGLFCYRKKQAVTLVHGVGELRLGAPPTPGKECRLQFQWRGESGGIHSFDWRLAGPTGEMLLEAEGCCLIEIGAAAA
ncbi:MAG TPA: beta-ketoacyl synthase N-terminal-like domain-containing protein [Bryobacteraceae bacterium]|jgi:acyl transferase domain-containing protein/NAD(P)-dependent dehydrogenase (short-subunit alcohol dehydrogenase family)/acyl carrier protein